MQLSTRMLFLLVVLLVGSAPAMADQVDINSADATALAAALTGVGEAKARSIVAYREQNGPFDSADDLVQVKGIGERLLEINRANIRVRTAAD